MNQVRIVTDSTADIPAELRESLGIELVPLKVHFGMETYRDQIDLETAEFFEKLVASPELPTTSQPSPVEFLETFKRLTDASDDPVVSIHLSSGMSGTYQSAQLAKTMLDEGADVTVIDSKSASYGFGMLVVAAAKAARSGQSKEQIIALVERMRREMKLYFLVDTLEFLQKGGRIGKAAALVGSLLNIKPILSISDAGIVYSVDKVRGQKKAMTRIIELLKHDLSERPIDIAIAYAESIDNAKPLHDLMQEHFTVESARYTRIGAVIGTHTGPGVVAVFACPQQVSG
ncbi:DegV family protein [Paenibacillus piri]|uniref:DegV family protein n=1 Tax=Paenibacillus piri TaxID=2547395 RepID=A0A4R5KR82_9BACL|nr:DegV family protein [Paenibacillus piri]TDF98299.1 DegV family protein [Paenibacillus piri]